MSPGPNSDCWARRTGWAQPGEPHLFIMRWCILLWDLQACQPLTSSAWHLPRARDTFPARVAFLINLVPVTIPFLGFRAELARVQKDSAGGFFSPGGIRRGARIPATGVRGGGRQEEEKENSNYHCWKKSTDAPFPARTPPPSVAARTEQLGPNLQKRGI